MKKVFPNFSLIFSAGLPVVFAYGVYESISYMYLAKIFPMSISLFLFVLSIVSLIQEIHESRTIHATTVNDEVSTVDLESHWDIPMTEVWSKLLVYLAGILILYFFVWIIGYPLIITLFIILFYRYVAETGWIRAFIAGAAGMGFLALVSKLLNMEWPEGLIYLPWPLG